jgi:hypothetical protein
MPGFVLTSTSLITCTHQGKATPNMPSAKVTIMGMPVVTLAVPYAIAGCQLPTVTAGAPPCATGKFTAGATRVTSLNMPLVIVGSTSTCAPTAQPMLIGATQTRVTAS